jgi:putative ABC transport system permease protein
VNFRDLLDICAGNLFRMKLRTSLTIMGVVIAIGAFVAMLSFGAGMQQTVADQFNDLGLLSTLQVYPPRESAVPDTGQAVVLDDDAVRLFANLPGVRLAYPMFSFSVTVSAADTQVTTTAQALPDAAVQTKMFSRPLAGSVFDGSNPRDALITDALLSDLGVDDPDSAIGLPLVVSTRVASADSGLARFFQHTDLSRERVGDLVLRALGDREQRAAIVRDELGGALRHFLDGYLNDRVTVRDTLVVRGVLERGGPARIKPLMIAVTTAQRLNPGGITGDPAQLFGALESGTLPGVPGDTGGRQYPQVTLDLDSRVSHTAVSDTIESLGYRTFSYAAEFQEIRQFFLFFDIALGVVGFIALVVASLGIVNTLVTSIIERRREIGVLKSLGADESYMRTLFLVESGVIGAVGSLAGICLGWVVSRIGSIIARIWMEKQGLPGMDMFAIPPWLIATAFLFGLGVSVLAGFYPAARAARVDPVEALRNE